LCAARSLHRVVERVQHWLEGFGELRLLSGLVRSEQLVQLLL
jgi:hypothetical protein